MTDMPKTVFVTKYALTDGITEREVQSQDGKYVWVKNPNVSYGVMLGDKDWHLTREAAVTRANAMRDTKLASLHQQAERVKGLSFE